MNIGILYEINETLRFIPSSIRVFKNIDTWDNFARKVAIEDINPGNRFGNLC